MFVTVIVLLLLALLVSQQSYGRFLKVTDSILFEYNTINRRRLTPHIMPCYTYKMAIVS